MAASNVPKDRMTSDDLYVYNSSTSSVTLSPAQDKKLVPCEIANQIMSIFKGRLNDQQMICNKLRYNKNKQTSTIISIHVYCLLFLERKSTGAVLHCNGKIPCLASLLYSGTEFKMKNQGIIKVKLNKFHSNCFLKILNKLKEIFTQMISHLVIFQGLYNEALKRNYNMDEMVAIPIINDLESLDKLKEILHKYCGSNIIIIRNQGVFIWADDWQKCKAA